MNPTNEEPGAEMERYLAGEMTGAEYDAFEARLLADPESAELLRAWTQADPPGLARAEQLAVPPLRSPQKAATVVEAEGGARRRRVWRFAAAAAIFIVGFGFGRVDRPREQGPAEHTVLPSVSLTGSDPQQEQGPPATGEAQLPRLEEPDETSPERELAFAPSIRRFQDERGRLVIETGLNGAKPRAMWIVDGAFRLDQPARAEEEER